MLCTKHFSEIVKFLVPQGKTEAFKSRLGNWIMDSPCDNLRPVGRLQADTVIRDPVSEVQFRDEKAETRLVLHARHARRNDVQCDALWYTDTETDVLLLMLAHSKKLTLKRCYMKKGRGANIMCNSTQAMLTTASWGALLGVNSIIGCDNIAAFFGKGKWKAIQLLQPMEGTSELWRVSRERVISIQREL